MSKTEVRELLFSTVSSLANSQGFYGRLLKALNNADEDTIESLVNALVDKGVKDSLDIVMFFEC